MAQVPAGAHTLKLLTQLAQQVTPVAASMPRDLALPRSGTYHLLDTMIDAGYVTHYPDQRVYGLGLSAYELASGYMRQESVQRLARRPLADPADRSGHSAHLSVLRGREVVYVIEERAPGRVRLITDVGARLFAHTTASGRAMLAELPPAQVRALYPSAKDLLGSALSGPRTPIELRRALSDVRSAGVASDEGRSLRARHPWPATANRSRRSSRRSRPAPRSPSRNWACGDRPYPSWSPRTSSTTLSRMPWDEGSPSVGGTGVRR